MPVFRDADVHHAIGMRIIQRGGLPRTGEEAEVESVDPVVDGEEDLDVDPGVGPHLHRREVCGHPIRPHQRHHAKSPGQDVPGKERKPGNQARSRRRARRNREQHRRGMIQ